MTLLLLVGSPCSSAGTEDSGRSAPAEPVSGDQAPDDAFLRDTFDPDPTGAALRSAVLPGWGQLYNRRPLKGVIMFAVESGLLAWLLVEHFEAEEARDMYYRTGDPFYEREYDRHSQRRLDLIWYTSGAWLYGILDAYVDAHLYSFYRENERFRGEVGLGLELRFGI